MPDETFGPLTFHSDGRISISLEDDGGAVELRRPKYGEFKRHRLAFSALQTDFRAEIEAVRNIEDRIARADQLDEANRHLEEKAVAWWRDVSTTLGSSPLPDSEDDWPTVLIVGEGVLVKVIDHWQNRPLARGRMGQPVPAGAPAA